MLGLAGQGADLTVGGDRVVVPVDAAGTTEQPGCARRLGFGDPDISVGPTHDAVLVGCDVVELAAGSELQVQLDPRPPTLVD